MQNEYYAKDKLGVKKFGARHVWTPRADRYRMKGIKFQKYSKKEGDLVHRAGGTTQSALPYAQCHVGAMTHSKITHSLNQSLIN